MDLKDYIDIFRRRLRTLIIITQIACAASMVFAYYQDVNYEASATLAVGGYLQLVDPSVEEIRTGAELAQTYAVLAETSRVLDPVIAATGTSLTVDELRERIDVEVIGSTPLLEITMRDDDSQRVATIVNEVAEQVIVQSPNNLLPDQQQQLDRALSAIEKLEVQLSDAEGQLDTINLQLNTTVNLDDTRWLRLLDERSMTVTHIDRVTANLADFSSLASRLQSRSNVLEIVNLAEEPTEPVGISKRLMILFGTLAGLAIAAIVVILQEYFDDSLDVQEVRQLGIPIMATIPSVADTRSKEPYPLITLKDPSHPSSDVFWTLRTNLLFASNHHKEGHPRLYLITSPGVSEGKSLTIANLAVTLASSQQRVLLIDADLRCPQLAPIFGLSESPGLIDLLSLPAGELEQKLNEDPDALLSEYTRPTDVTGLSVLPSGGAVANSTELLDSISLKQLAKAWQQSDQYDVFLFDTPPALLVSDAYLLALNTASSVILLSRQRETRRDAVLAAKEQFDRLGVPIQGLVVNCVNPHDLGRTYKRYLRATP